MTELRASDLEPILALAGKLASPFDLSTMLREVTNAAVQVLHAERGAVWLYDAAADELLLSISSDMEKVLRMPAGKGIAGNCARTRQVINVSDCYADPRFDPDLDKRSGKRTRCMLTLPLVDHKDVLVGVMQVINKAEGVFESQDESLATVLAAQCAIALQRARMTEALLEGERMRQQLELARAVQMSTLPASMPFVAGYDVHGSCQPAELTGGDTFDLSLLERELLMVLGDATGHGIAPALSVTQMQAMLRVAFRLGADLETIFRHVNNELAEMLPDDRFITAFVGLLDASTHEVRFHSGGQGPILQFEAASGTCAEHPTTSFPLAAMPLSSLPAAARFAMRPGDILILLSDGFYEFRNAAGETFGEQRIQDLVRLHHEAPMGELSAILFDSVRAFAAGAPQEDDMTLVLLKRDAGGASSRAFARSLDALAPMARWSADFFARERIDASLLPAIDQAIEEFFVNMVEYGGGGRAVQVGMKRIEGGVEVTLTEPDAEPFDVTRIADARTDAPIEQREPGGLGMHLARRLVDAIEYEYLAASRQSRITFRKTVGGPRARD